MIALGCICKHRLRTLPGMETRLWSRRAVDLCRVATCLCLAS